MTLALGTEDFVIIAHLPAQDLCSNTAQYITAAIYYIKSFTCSSLHTQNSSQFPFRPPVPSPKPNISSSRHKFFPTAQRALRSSPHAPLDLAANASVKAPRIGSFCKVHESNSCTSFGTCRLRSLFGTPGIGDTLILPSPPDCRVDSLLWKILPALLMPYFVAALGRDSRGWKGRRRFAGWIWRRCWMRPSRRGCEDEGAIPAVRVEIGRRSFCGEKRAEAMGAEL